MSTGGSGGRQCTADRPGAVARPSQRPADSAGTSLVAAGVAAVAHAADLVVEPEPELGPEPEPDAEPEPESETEPVGAVVAAAALVVARCSWAQPLVALVGGQGREGDDWTAAHLVVASIDTFGTVDYSHPVHRNTSPV